MFIFLPVPAAPPTVFGINSSDAYSVEMWIEGPSLKDWIGLPVQYNLTIYEHPFFGEDRRHVGNISFPAEVSKNLSINFLPYLTNLAPCDESTPLEIKEAFDQIVLVNTSYHGLYPYTNYSITVQACTIVGCGNASSHFYFLSDEEIPACQPNITSVVNSSSTSLYVTWLPPLFACRNGIISNYSVVVIDTLSLRNTTYYTGSTNITVSELKKNLEYCVMVAAATSKGFGSYSDPKCNFTDQDSKYKSK